MTSASQHLREATALAAAHGFRLYRKRRHLIWRNDDGVQVVCAASPSCRHALANFKARLRRYGR
jgi:hypothetical protein